MSYRCSPHEKITLMSKEAHINGNQKRCPVLKNGKNTASRGKVARKANHTKKQKCIQSCG